MNQDGDSFTNELNYNVGVQPSSVAAADLDQDGDLDLAVTNRGSDSLSTLINQGDGTFLAQGRFRSGAGAQSIVARDFNGDGLPDLAMAIPNSGEVVVLLNTSAETPELVSLDGSGSAYRQDFDKSLAASDGPGAKLPVGWSATLDGEEMSFLSQPFPTELYEGLLSAGLPNAEDRAVSLGVTDSNVQNELAWTAKIEGADAHAVRLAFDIEAWSVDRSTADALGEAVFNVVLEADAGQGFKAVHDFGRVTTGQVLKTPDAPVGAELWKTDGTTVSLVADIAPGPDSSNPDGFTVFNDEFYFVAGDRSIYKTDGTQVHKVADIPCDGLEFPDRCPTNRQSWLVGDVLYYDLLPFNLNQSEPDMLARIDSSGTTTIIPNTERFNVFFHSTVYNDELYLVPQDDFGVSTVGRELWRFDGETLELAADINQRIGSPPAQSSTPGNFVEFRGDLYFTAGPRLENDRELWKFDGTTVTRVAEIMTRGLDGSNATWCGSCVDILGVFKDKLYFNATDDFESASADYDTIRARGVDRSLWTYDGAQVEKFHEGFVEFSTDAESFSATVFNDELYFVAADEASGRELWKTDGVDTVRVTDINPGKANSLLEGSSFNTVGRRSDFTRTRRQQLISLNDELYFFAETETGSSKLWKTDGERVTEVTNGNPQDGFEWVSPYFLVNKNELFFEAFDGVTGRQLWKTDGHKIVRITGINAGPDLSGVMKTAFNGEIYFAATNGDGQTPNILDGNARANRIEFDSGPIPASIPEGSTLRLRFITPEAGAHVGYIYGVDSFEFHVLAAGDANADGQFDQLDIVTVLQSAKYLTGQPATFAEGDFTGDGVFDQADIVATLQTGHYLNGPYVAIQESAEAAHSISKRPRAEIADTVCLDFI